jgi:type I restriction enzyme, S subunit
MSGADRQQLPKGWERTTLDAVLRVIRGVTYRKDESSKTPVDGFLPILRANNIQASLEFENLVYVPAKDVSEIQRIKVGDIVIAASSGSLSVVGKAAQLKSPWVGSFGAFCFGLRPEPLIDERFVGWFLHTNEYRNRVSKAAAGININNLRAEHIERTPFRIPPFREQERIADALDELLSDFDAGVAALGRVQTKLKHYRAAVLKAAVEGTLVPSQQPYPVRQIGEAIESLGQGWSPKCESEPSADRDTWAVIKTTAIQPLRYLEEHNKLLPAALKPRPHLELKEGDLLITRAGPRSRVGIACLVKRTRPRLMLCDKAYRLRCKKNTLSPAFLEVVLNAPNIVSALDKLKTGINDSGLNLTQGRFSELLVPFPKPDEQHAIVEAVEDQLSVIEHLEADLDAKLKSAQSLRQSILQRAFTGQLVPQDPNDEPASELIKRISAERRESARQATAAKEAKRTNAKPKTLRRRDAAKNLERLS